MSMEALYSGLAGARVGGGNYLGMGVFDLEILRIFRQKSTNAEKAGVDQTIVELRVAKVVTAVPARDGWSGSNGVGEIVALVVEHTAGFQAQAALGRFKQLIAAAVGFDYRGDVPNDVCEVFGIPLDHPNRWAALAGMAGDGSGDLLAGSKVRAIGTPTTSKKNKVKIVSTSYTPVPAE